MRQKNKANLELANLIQELDRCAQVLIVDISYVGRSGLVTSVPLELICQPYEHKSLQMRSNEPFREWDEIFAS